VLSEVSRFAIERQLSNLLQIFGHDHRYRNFTDNEFEAFQANSEKKVLVVDESLPLAFTPLFVSTLICSVVSNPSNKKV